MTTRRKASAVFFPGALGTTCLWDIARLCNPRVRDAALACGTDKPANFLQLDYPNYPGKGDGQTVVQVARHINLNRS